MMDLKVQGIRKRTLGRSIVLATVLTFAQGMIATMEVIRISQLRSAEACLWGALNEACCILALLVVVDEPERKWLVPFYVAAAAAATYCGIAIGRLFP